MWLNEDQPGFLLLLILFGFVDMFEEDSSKHLQKDAGWKRSQAVMKRRSGFGFSCPTSHFPSAYPHQDEKALSLPAASGLSQQS